MFKKMCTVLEVDREKCLKNYGYTSAQMQRDVAIIKAWMKMQPHLPNLEDECIEIMLIRAKFSLEKAKRRIDNYFTLKNLTPEFCKDIDPLSPEIQNIHQHGTLYVLKNLTPSGQRVFIHKYIGSEKFNCVSYSKYCIMWEEIRMRIDYSDGAHIIHDCSEFTFQAFITLTPAWYKKFYTLLVDGFGSKVSGIHVLYAPSFFDSLFMALKPLTKPKIYNRIKLHQNLESLHKDVPKSILPREYGGDGPSCSEIQCELKNELIRWRPMFMEIQKQTVDESKRPIALDCDNFGSMHGSFKTLCLD